MKKLTIHTTQKIPYLIWKILIEKLELSKISLKFAIS